MAKPPGREVFAIHLGRRNRGLPSGSPAAAGWLRTAEATPDIRVPLQTRSGEFEPAQRIKLLRDGARIIGRGASCPREDPTGVFEVLREDLDRCRRVPARVHHHPIHSVADVCEPQRRFDGSTMVTPQSAHGLEPVVIEELPALACDQPNSFDDVGEGFLAYEVVEVHPHPARLDPLATIGDLGLELVRVVKIDPQKAVPVRARAGAPSPGLNPEQIIEECHHEVVSRKLPLGYG